MLSFIILFILTTFCLAAPSAKQDHPSIYTNEASFHLVAKTNDDSIVTLEFFKPDRSGWNGRRLIGPVSSNPTEHADYTQSSTMDLKDGVLVAKAQLGSNTVYTTVKEATKEFFLTFVKDAKKHTGDLKVNDKGILMKGKSEDGWVICDYIGQKAIGWNIGDNKDCERVELSIKKAENDDQS